jgi:hypothetical protein
VIDAAIAASDVNKRSTWAIAIINFRNIGASKPGGNSLEQSSPQLEPITL